MSANTGEPTRDALAGDPLHDPCAEGLRIATTAKACSLSLKLMGGVGVALRCPSASAPPLARSYADIDLAGRRHDSGSIVDLMARLGYRPNHQFNTLHGSSRLFFWDETNGRQVDVFLDTFQMCHRIDLSRRVEMQGDTLPLADLLLTKLQVVETNEKDLKDISAILADHEFSDDDTGINIPYLATLTAKDWGLWKTVSIVAERADGYVTGADGFDHRDRVRRQVRGLLERLAREPKTRSWRIRDRVGERMRWYELPEENTE